MKHGSIFTKSESYLPPSVLMEGTSEQERRAGYKWEPDWEGNPSIVAFEFESAEFLVLKI